MLSDLFKNIGNKAWDLSRVLSGFAFLAVIGLAAYKTYLGQDVILKDLSGSIMEILIGSGLIIGGTDVAAAHAASRTDPD